jgi:hypothetical protein
MPPALPPAEATVRLRRAWSSTLPGDLAKIACQHCELPLDLHQPDAEFPARLLGTCDACHRWYVMDLVPDEQAVVIIALPDPDSFRNALAN